VVDLGVAGNDFHLVIRSRFQMGGV